VQGGQIPRAFTLEGWDKRVEKRIDNMPDEIAANPALKQAFGRMTPEKIKDELTSRYATEFRNAWRTFLESARLIPVADLTDATSALDELSQETSPMIGVLKAAYNNSLIDIGGRYEDEVRGEFDPLGRFLGEIETDGSGETGAAAYIKLMADVPKLTAKAAEELQSTGQCAVRLKKLNTEIEERRRAISRLIGGGTNNIARSAATWLSRPLDAAKSAAGGEVCACLNRMWEPVFKKFQTTFEQAYPFNRSAENAAPRAEVAGFFSSTGGIFSYDEAEGAPARAEGISMSGDYMQALSVAEQLRQAMPGGHLSVAFTITASSRNLTGLRMVRFEYGSSRFDYAMGQDESRNFRWPTPGADLASLSIEPINQAFYANSKRFVDEWALMRLFDEATASGSTMAWSFTSTSSGQTLVARLDLSGSGAEFIRSGHFSRFRCPSRVCP
jgi:type VI protein secretion system component VasK